MAAETSSRRMSQKVEAPWLSLLIIPNDSASLLYGNDAKEGALRRFSANVLLPCSRRSSLSSPQEIRRNTYCYGNHLTAPNNYDVSERLYSDDSVEILL